MRRLACWVYFWIYPFKKPTKCGFCGEIHGQTCPEFKVEHIADYYDKSRSWVCRYCRMSIVVTASEAVERGWLLHEKYGSVWAECPVCSRSGSETLRADVEEWERRGSPRGDN